LLCSGMRTFQCLLERIESVEAVGAEAKTTALQARPVVDVPSGTKAAKSRKAIR